MKALFAAMQQDPAMQRLQEYIEGEAGETLAYGLGGTQKHAAFAACYAAHPQTMVVIVHSQEAAADWCEDLAALLPHAHVAALPELDAVQVQATAKGMERAARRMETLGLLMRTAPSIVIAHAAAAVQKDMSRGEFERLSLVLHIGDEMERGDLLARFVQLGYEHADEVEHVGQFAARGGILDVFPINARQPVRIELFGDTVDSLREYDLGTKRSLHHIEQVRVLPLMRMDAAQRPELFLSYLSGRGLVVFDEPARIREQIRSMVRENPDMKDAVFSWEELLTAAKGNRIAYSALMLQQIPGADPAHMVSMTVTSMTPFQRQMDLFESEANRWVAQKQRVLVLLGNKEKANRLREFFAKRRVPSLVGGEAETLREDAVNVRVGTLLTGFEMAAAHLVVVTEQDIFGHQKRKGAAQRQTGGARIAHFRDIKPGDYVVHESHGIGKYVGVETLVVAGIHRDYLHIKYGGDDKLFVPTDQVGLLQKYIGAEGEVPRLSRMGGTEWVRAKARAKKSVEDIAKHLIEIYAKRRKAEGHAFPPDDSSQREFEEAFPYQETDDQLKAIAEIKADMEQKKPMERLLCGDVGFGKTEVAIRAAYKAAMDGKQVAVLVPTTVLAQQHFQTFTARFQDFAPRIDVICRFRTAKQQAETIEKVRKGQIDILIGTHAILNPKKVVWKDLGLLIVDEEQRFGVKQKDRIKSLAAGIDVLTLSATPIPRTLHMSLVGARDMSIIETPPADRFPVQTYVVENNDTVIANAIKREIRRGGQIYFVYNRVDTIDKMRDRLRSLVPDARIQTAHGQMPEGMLERVMMDFYEGDYDILLATSIVENGLDVANANTIIVYNADYFGLSQLYQMRGRVGRSHHMAFAYFVYQADKILTETAEKRLQAMKEFAELGAGFKIAMRDLQIRGAGNLLGAQQHGHIASIGFEMYCKLLEEAVATLKDGKATEEPVPEPLIDLTVEAYIDGDFIADAMHKIEIYQRIAAIRTEEEISSLLDELMDRFGEPTKPVLRLLDVARIKNMARALSVRMVKQQPLALDICLLDGKQLPARAVFALDHAFGRRMRKRSDPDGFRFALDTRGKADIAGFALRVLRIATGEEHGSQPNVKGKGSAV